MNTKYPDLFLERSGYLKCKIEVGDYIRLRQLAIGDDIKNLHRKFKTTESLVERTEQLTELANLVGEREGLAILWQKLSSSQYEAPSQHQLLCEKS